MTRKPKAGGDVPPAAAARDDVARLHAETITRLRKLTTETKNPLYLWEAVARCLASGKPLPRWARDLVLTYAMQFYTLSLRCVADDDPDAVVQGAPLTGPEALKLVPHALELTRTGQRWNAFTAYRSDHKHMQDAALHAAIASVQDLEHKFPEDSPLRRDWGSELSASNRIAARRGIGERPKNHHGSDIQELERAVRRRVAKGRRLK